MKNWRPWYEPCTPYVWEGKRWTAPMPGNWCLMRPVLNHMSLSEQVGSAREIEDLSRRMDDLVKRSRYINEHVEACLGRLLQCCRELKRAPDCRPRNVKLGTPFARPILQPAATKPVSGSA